MGTEQGGGDGRRDVRDGSKRAQSGQRFHERECQRDELTKTVKHERGEENNKIDMLHMQEMVILSLEGGHLNTF